MKKWWVILITPIFISPLLAQDAKTINDPNAQRRQVGSFHAIHAHDGIDIYLTQGAEDAVAVSASKSEYRDKIVTKVENGELKLYYEESWAKLNWRDRKLRAYISFKNLDQLKASGGSDVIVNGTITGKTLVMDLNGGSDFSGDVKIDDLDIGQSGGSDVSISGSAVNLKISASGGSDFKGYELRSDFAVIEASGGSDAQLNVSKELAAEASGGSDIEYKGNAVIKHKSSSGGSSVTRRE